MAGGDDQETRVARPGSGSAAPTRVLSTASPDTLAMAPGTAGKRVIKQRFVLDESLGSGGMGAVYRAVDLRKQEADNRDPFVAIKLLNDEFRAHPDAFISLEREARKSQTLAHPNIVNVYDFDRDGDTVFMTMECLSGQPLDALLSEHPDGLDKPRALEILSDLIAAMSYAHSHRIAHSDLKPGNVFVTEAGTVKVLDFGIARAVTDLGAPEPDAAAVTRFDPASLGALTPAYASLEMLEGAEPTLVDDIYALGCVAYELFTGRHPFDGRDAAEARREGLAPRRIAALSRRQWRALERSLAFERDARLATMEEFAAAFHEVRRSRWLAVTGVLVLGAVAFVFLERAPNDEELSNLRADVALDVKQQLAASEVDRLLADVHYDDAWLTAFGEVFEEYRDLVPGTAPGLADRRGRLATALLNEARRRREQGDLDEAERLLEAAAGWGSATGAERQRLDDARATAQGERNAALAREQDRLKRELEAERARQEAQRTRRLQAQALAAVRDSLACEGFDAERARQRLDTLRQVHPEGFSAQRGAFAAQLAGCVTALAGHNPAAAERLEAEAVALLPGETALTALVIDPCGALTPGTGGRGNRFTCHDDLTDGGRGPELVVVPPIADGAPYAMARFETAGAELSRFCRSSGRCPAETFSGNGPATGIGRALAEAYVAWLSAETGFDYRIPDYRRWLHAARADGAPADPNRNCTLRAGPIRRGGAPLPVDTGRANAWGLVNAAGNVQELTLEDDRLIAAGGHYDDPLDRCTYEARRRHSDGGDELTGLRVMRALADARG